MSEKRYPRTILATACIPWTEAWEFDELDFRTHVRAMIKRGLSNIYLFGTAGEGYAVTDDQFGQIVQVFAQEMQTPDSRPMVGLVSLSFATMLQRLRQAYTFGIRDFQFALPAWGALTDRELFAFFHQLCDPFPDCRFFHYNLMRTKRLLGMREYRLLAREIPNFVGAKFSTGDIPTIRDLADKDCPLQFFLTEDGFGYGSLIGEFGLLLSVAATNIEKAWDYFAAGVQCNQQQLLGMQQELSRMTRNLISMVGSDKIDGAFDKIYCKLLNQAYPLRLLPPYEGASEASFAEFAGFLKKEYPQWIDREVR